MKIEFCKFFGYSFSKENEKARKNKKWKIFLFVKIFHIF